jgi:peptidyl-tRNA hydrolase, PTH1 family
LIVGLGNPGDRYAGTRHNLGFEVAAELSRRWDLPKARKRYGGLITDGRIGPGGPRVAILVPQTYMNDSGSAAGPARGELGVPLDRVVVLHDEIDLPFSEVRSKLGGGVAGHNGLKSLSQGLGGKEFWRVRGGVGRPESTDPDVVSSYVLSRFREPDEAVRALIHEAADEAERLVERITTATDDARAPRRRSPGATRHTEQTD